MCGFRIRAGRGWLRDGSRAGRTGGAKAPRRPGLRQPEPRPPSRRPTASPPTPAAHLPTGRAAPVPVLFGPRARSSVSCPFPRVRALAAGLTVGTGGPSCRRRRAGRSGLMSADAAERPPRPSPLTNKRSCVSRTQKKGMELPCWTGGPPGNAREARPASRDWPAFRSPTGSC